MIDTQILTPDSDSTVSFPLYSVPNFIFDFFTGFDHIQTPLLPQASAIINFLDKSKKAAEEQREKRHGEKMQVFRELVSVLKDKGLIDTMY